MQAELHLRTISKRHNDSTTRATMRTVASVCTMLAIVMAISAAASAVSIEAEPVKVTHRNSGPRYDIDEVERARQALNEVDKPKLLAAAGAEQPAREPAEAAEEVPAVGRVAIRRIFLFPIMRPNGGGDELSAQNSEERPSQPHGAGPAGREQENAGEPRVPFLFAKPFWPFMTPARPAPAGADHERPPHHIISHLFGADEASRPPSADEHDQDRAPSGRDEQHSGPPRALIDPIQMMMDMMHQAISSQLGPALAKDLSNNDGNHNNNRDEANGDNSPAESTDERPLMPAAGRFGQPSLFGLNPELGAGHNETREDIVEIEGKKYLRKTVVNRHVGDNIVLMTRRLIFVPLNETDASGAPEASPTDSPASATTNPAGEVSGEVPSLTGIHRVGANKPTAESDQESSSPSNAPTPSSTTPTPTTTTTMTTTTTTEEPSTTSARPETTPVPSVAPEQPTSAEPREEVTEVPRSPSAERAEGSTTNKAAERLVEPAPKPATSS